MGGFAVLFGVFFVGNVMVVGVGMVVLMVVGAGRRLRGLRDWS